jgi:hypothetical protein
MYVTSIEKLSSAVNSSREQELRQQIESITKENLKLNKDMSILTSTNEKLKYLIDHNFQPRSDCTNCPGKDSQLKILNQKVDEMKLQHHEMVLQQEINKSDIENADGIVRNGSSGLLLLLFKLPTSSFKETISSSLSTICICY